MMNIRTHFNFSEAYHNINREERNLAAIFYHLLLSKNNLGKFLELIDCTHNVDNKHFGIFFEYAFIRDIWDSSKAGNEEKRNYILSSLNLPNNDMLQAMSIYDFNEYFGAVPKPSATHIQSPGKWSISYYDKNIADNESFMKICRFKWCFNAKPDIVIHTSNGTAICLEAKLESGEGAYPGSSADQAIFKKRGLSTVSQGEIQGMILNDLLGFDIIRKYIVKHNALLRPEYLTWKQVFDSLDYSDSPDFIKSWICRLN